MNKATQAYYNFLLNRNDILEQLRVEYERYTKLRNHDHMHLLTSDLRKLLNNVDNGLVYDETETVDDVFLGDFQLVYDLLYAAIDQIDFAHIAHNLVSLWE